MKFFRDKLKHGFLKLIRHPLEGIYFSKRAVISIDNINTKLSGYYFLGLVAIIYFTYNLLAVYMGAQGNISYIGHIIGFIIGLPLGIIKSEEWSKNLLITGGLFLIYLVIVWLLFPSLGLIL